MHLRTKLAIICLLFLFAGTAGLALAQPAAPVPTPVLYLGDIYQPYCDPDDYWDLATAYALAKLGRIELLGIVLDYPLEPDSYGFVMWGAGDPSVTAVAQLNYVTGLAVPVAVGSSVPYQSIATGDVQMAGPDAGGVNLIIEKLRSSPEPVAVVVVGSCRTLALAAWKAPELFQTKCRGVYLNADTVRQDENRPNQSEWNRSLDPEAYLALWKLPCPIYWLPCFEDPSSFKISRYSGFWLLNQGDLLPYLSKPVQSYFLYGLTRNTNQNWLSHLQSGPAPEALGLQSQKYRNMWCTAGFLHLAGLTVTHEGKLAALDETAQEEATYDFVPIRSAELKASGKDRWEESLNPDGQFIIELTDTDAYAGAMPKALRTLLEAL